MKRKIFFRLMLAVAAFAMIAFVVPQEQKKGWSMGDPKRIQRKEKPV